MSKYYRKINSPYKRDKKGVFLPEFADPVFEEHLDDTWVWSYKWDGTSVGYEVGGEVFGRTPDSALSWDQWKAVLAWQQHSEGTQPEGVTHVYGELIGPNVQGNPHKFDHYWVAYFDTRYGEGYSQDLAHCDVGYATLGDAIDAAHAGRLSDILPGTKFGYFEGIVGRLAADHTVITKLKVKDHWSW